MQFYDNDVLVLRETVNGVTSGRTYHRQNATWYDREGNIISDTDVANLAAASPTPAVCVGQSGNESTVRRYDTASLSKNSTRFLK